MTPRNVVVVLLDSLNRHLLGSYGSREFETPELDRFAARATRFTRHHTGSLPCIPARHDILCGALDFLWRPWGSIEVWEDSIVHQLRRAGVTTMLLTDHPHLFEVGGENYHTDFDAWGYERGHESDPWRTRADPSWIGAPALPAATGWIPHHYNVSRTWFRDEADFPGPRTMAAAARWLEEEAPTDAPFFLFVDEFDPHEPFDTPEPWASRYVDTGDEPRLIWPPYAVDALAKGILDAASARQIRANYGSKLSMIDHWFGRVVEALDRTDRWRDTAVIVCTDHGHYLGEKDIWGKPGVPVYEPLGHIPLLVAWPGRDPQVVDALTTSVDLFATLTDVFAVEVPQRTHGHSLVPVLEGRADSVREFALTGVWGREVHVTDGHRKYARAPVATNQPLFLWSNRWSTMPVPAFPELRLPRPDRRARLDYMPGSDVPVIRQPFAEGDPMPLWAATARSRDHLLFDLDDDPAETHDLAGSPAEADAVELLRVALASVDAPDEQYQRLGIS